jgi:alpha-tubulin suppressor-like RCC1 family protein
MVALPGPAAQVATGSGHSCARLRDGTVMCWGADGFGQLGNGLPLAASASPVPVPMISGAAWIAAGNDHVCVVTAAGQVRCWGSDSSGQLGDGAVGPDAPEPGPPIASISGATTVGAGIEHTCILLASGQVACMGTNRQSQLARPAGTPLRSPNPLLVDAMYVSTATELSVGEHHSCVRDASGVKCWGRNDVGQLGFGTMTTAEPIPMNVP